MIQLGLTTKDKLILACIIIGEIVSYRQGNLQMVGILGAILLTLLTVSKIFNALCVIHTDTEKILNNHTLMEQALAPINMPTPVSPTQYQVASIERLLSSIQYDENRTMFDYVVESSTTSNLVDNLVLTQDTILNSLDTLSLKNG